MTDLTHGDHQRFLPEDIERVLAETFIERVETHDQLTSTNDRALQLATENAGPLPLLVLAEQQTAGRGRGTNRWWASAGALTFSVLLEAQPDRLPPSAWPQASMTAGLAVCEGLEDLLGESRPGIKWPNDVLIGCRKVSGILVETPRSGANHLVIGIGINVNNSITSAPKDLTCVMTSLLDVAGHRFALCNVLVPTLQRLAERLKWIGARSEELRERWRRRCLLTGRVVHVDQDVRVCRGLCRGIDDHGALLIETDQGVERCLSGAVKLVE